jgi:hypothetical protein
MAQRILYFMRGMGTILEIAPDPERKVHQPFYRPVGSVEEELADAWRAVGDQLRAALYTVRREHQEQETSAR